MFCFAKSFAFNKSYPLLLLLTDSFFYLGLFSGLHKLTVLYIILQQFQPFTKDLPIIFSDHSFQQFGMVSEGVPTVPYLVAKAPETGSRCQVREGRSRR